VVKADEPSTAWDYELEIKKLQEADDA